MKKAIALLAALIIVFSFCACGKDNDGSDSVENVTYSWPKADWFKPVPEYSKGDVVYSNIGTASTVSVSDTSYEEFVKYIDNLKSRGFEFYDNTGSSASENIALDKNGTALWVGTNGTVYVSLIYISSDSVSFENYNCNVRIYSYSSKPASWQ